MKIVTLLPSATEIVCALGLQDRLVAVSHECDYPDAVKTLPKATRSNIGGSLSPVEVDGEVQQAVAEGKALYSVERALLAALQPDLIVTQGLCEVCAVHYETLQEIVKGFPGGLGERIELVCLEGKSFGQILGDIERVAEVTQRETTAAELIRGLRHRWAALQTQRPAAAIRVLALEWPDPPFYAGHWVPEMIDMAGGVDVMGQMGIDSGRCSWQEIAERDPDMIVSIACGFDLKGNREIAEKLYDHSEAKILRALRNQQVWACDANAYFSRPGPRIVTGAEILQGIFTQGKERVDHALRVTGPC